MSETTPATDVNVDRMFVVLSDKRRRLILNHLLARDSPATVPELVDRLVTAELNGHERPEDLKDRIVVNLHHIHLPKLAELNLVHFDRERGEVSLREAAPAVEPYLALAMDDE